MIQITLVPSAHFIITLYPCLMWGRCFLILVYIPHCAFSCGFIVDGQGVALHRLAVGCIPSKGKHLVHMQDKNTFNNV